MPGASFFVHLLAAVFLLCLGVWAIRQRRYWQVLQAYFVPVPRVWIDEPVRALAVLASALGLRFTIAGKGLRGALRPIPVASFLELHRQAGICAISVTGDGVLWLRVRTIPSNGKLLGRQLSEKLGLDVRLIMDRNSIIRGA